ncbi:hypothetical protein ACIGW8_37905 [Streptomyces sioyaensis]|uniref:hypothetical protein n=1 Tax=Streptomyces sioyaensis TaxID=67364 RepID=UPI0037D09D5C
MIRLPTNHAAITAPLVASNTSFPGIPIGRSTSDGRPFRLSPVLVDDKVLSSTNSIALGGLGSGKSTTAKIRSRRSNLYYEHQYVVIDSYGEQQDTRVKEGEWAPLTRDLGGMVVKAGTFTINPCSPEFPPEVREQLLLSLIDAAATEPLTAKAAHALQHALNNPKATTLNGVIEALQHPEEGLYTVEELTDWGVDAVLHLSKYTEGSLRGLFDRPDAGLPPCDLPMVTFDFTQLDRNSPAIPALMAAIACWVEHVWLQQSTAVHRHLVIEEAWQILLSDTTAKLLQRLFKNSRKDALSLDFVMHTLSDLGEGRAQHLAGLCTIAHVGQLGPEEAAKVGSLLELPAWAIEAIPTLGPGQAVWKVGSDYVDIIQTVIDEEEAQLTDTATRRHKAQQAQATDSETAVSLTKDTQLEEADPYDQPGTTEDGWDFELPPNTIDTVYTGPQRDSRHHAVIQAAREGRLSEAADLAALGEREDITAHGINSPQATAWLITRAEVAHLSGNTAQATHLRATVARMGNSDSGGAAWFENTDNLSTQWHQGPQPPQPAPSAGDRAGAGNGDQPPPRTRRRIWPYIAAIAALTLTAAGVWQKADQDNQREERQQKVAAYEGRSGAALDIDGVNVDVVAQWTQNRDRVIVELSPYADPDAKYVRLDGGRESAHSQAEDGWYAKSVEIELPVKDPLADVTVSVAIGGKSWKEGTRATSRTIRLSPTDVAYDADTGKRLPSDV